ncbi:MAG: SdpI family protein [Rhizobiales bacterium]|nr:SdpI family protein [Hyphomicrobiales bacterium]
MRIQNYEKNKKKIKLSHIVGFIILVLISFIAYPYVDTALLDAVNRNKFSPEEAFYVKLFYMLFMPAISFCVICLMTFVPVSDKEKIASSPNLPRYVILNIVLNVLIVIAHTANQLFITLPKHLFTEYADQILTWVFVLLSLFLLWASNNLAKNNKSLWSGFPTPWNQESELAWEKSQRFVGFSLSCVSILCLLMAFIYPISIAFILPVGLILSYAGCLIVSYYVYMQEQHYKSIQKQDDS